MSDENHPPLPLQLADSDQPHNQHYSHVGNGRDIVAAATEEAHTFRVAVANKSGTPKMCKLAESLRRAEEGQPSSQAVIESQFEAAFEENGHMPAMCFLGYYFETGVGGIIPNHEHARWFFRKDIECNNCDLARFVLAGKLTDDTPGEKDAPAAVRLYEEVLTNKGYNLVARHLAAILDGGATGVPNDAPRAVELYERAVRDGGSTEAMYSLARIYTEGRDRVPPNPPRAVELYERAIEDGQVSKAMNSLALLLQDGAEGVEMDVFRAVELFERAIADDNFDAMNNLGFLISEGYEGVPRDMPRVVQLYERAIDGGNLVSVRNLARVLKHGDDGVQADKPRALQLFERLKDDVDMYRSVQFDIALLISSDVEGIPLDTVRAADIYDSIIQEESNVSAMFNLACMLSDGRGDLKEDNVRAVALYERAILEGDDVLSMLNLGIMLGSENEGIDSNKERSIVLLERAGQEGRREANYHLGVVLAGFDGEAPDVHRSIKLFEQCIADLDHMGAMIDLSVVIGEGLHGVKPDVARALELSERAIALGLENDREELEKLGITIPEDAKLRDDRDAMRERHHAISRGSHLISMLNLAELLISEKVPWDVDRSLTLCERALKDPKAEKVCRFIQMDDLLRYTRKMSLTGGMDGRNAEKAAKICELIIDATHGINEISCGHAIRVYARLLLAGAEGFPRNVDKAIELYKKAVDFGDKKSALLLADLIISGAADVVPNDSYVFGLMGKVVADKTYDSKVTNDAVVIMGQIYLRKHARTERRRQRRKIQHSEGAPGVSSGRGESGNETTSQSRLKRRFLRHVGLALPIVRYVWTRTW